MMKRIFFLVYNFVVTPFAITVLLIFYWPFNKKIQKSMQLRRRSIGLRPTATAPIWIHASSGEFEYAKPVVDRLKSDYPGVPVLVTYSSPSYAEVISSYRGVDISLPSPLDTPGAVQSFLKKYQPRALLIARTDLWPQLLKSTQKYHIPALLFSCTFRPLKGFRQLLKPYYKMILNDLTEIFAVSELDKENLIETGTKTPISIYGDTRFDQVIKRINNPNQVKEQFFTTNEKPILIAGSTWPEDESILLPALAELLRNSNLRMIIAPHEPNANRIADIQSRLSQLKIETTIYSTEATWESPVLIIDTVGILADLYRIGSFAFIGGSFRSKVHSVMEPLAAGLPTILGPYCQNNREAMTFQKILVNSQSLVTVVRNEGELKGAILSLIQLDEAESLRQSIRKEVEMKAGATRYVLSWLESHIRIETKARDI